MSSWLPPDVATKYQLVEGQPRDGNLFYFQVFRQRDLARLILDGSNIRPEQASREAGELYEVAQLHVARHGQTPSGYPIAKYSTWIAEHDVAFRLAGPLDLLIVDFNGASWRDGRSRGMKPLNGEAESPMVEVVSRYALSYFAARRLAADGNVTVGGRSYPALKATGTNARYIDFAAWTQANNLVVGSGQDGTIKSFTKSGVLWIIPLAANKIKKGSAWQTLPDLVMRKDGKIYIPVVALTQS